MPNFTVANQPVYAFRCNYSGSKPITVPLTCKKNWTLSVDHINNKDMCVKGTKTKKAKCPMFYSQKVQLNADGCFMMGKNASCGAPTNKLVDVFNLAGRTMYLTCTNSNATVHQIPGYSFRFQCKRPGHQGRTGKVRENNGN